jgi:hypothetical protein
MISLRNTAFSPFNTAISFRNTAVSLYNIRTRRGATCRALLSPQHHDAMKVIRHNNELVYGDRREVSRNCLPIPRYQSAKGA